MCTELVLALKNEHIWNFSEQLQKRWLFYILLIIFKETIVLNA